MDLESFFTFVLFLLFFVLPSVLKQIRARKKKRQAAAPPKKKKKSSLFGKIGEQIQQFVQELEKQAQQARQKQRQEVADPGEEFWQTLAEEDPAETYEDAGADDTLEPASEPATEPFTVPPQAREQDKILAAEAEHLPAKRARKRRLHYRKDPLQNAIILSEILGKPKAFRNE